MSYKLKANVPTSSRRRAVRGRKFVAGQNLRGDPGGRKGKVRAVKTDGAPAKANSRAPGKEDGGEQCVIILPTTTFSRSANAKETALNTEQTPIRPSCGEEQHHQPGARREDNGMS
jgi:hypothetical protein